MEYELADVHAKCPVCAHGDNKRLWTIDSRGAARHFVPSPQASERFEALAKHIEALWGTDHCEVVRCEACSFTFANPYVAGDKRFYELAYERSGYPSWKWEFEEALAELKRLSTADFKLLEVGAGNGAFIRRAIGTVAQSQNILTTEYSDYGRSQIESLGVRCLPIDLRQIDDEAYRESFDAICMFQVLEHLDDLPSLFRHARFLLKKGGSFIAAVPNGERIAFNEKNGALLDMPPNHIGRWSKKSFEVAAESFHFSVASYGVEDFRLPSYFKQFVSYRVLRNAQKPGSVGSYVTGIRNRRLRSLFLQALAGLNAVTSLPYVPKMNRTLGDSQMVRYIKQ